MPFISELLTLETIIRDRGADRTFKRYFWVVIFLRLPFWVIICGLSYKLREYLQDLPDIQLSRYMVEKVFKKGVTVALLIVAMVIVDNIRCYGLSLVVMAEDEEHGTWKQCHRAMFAETGMSSILGITVWTDLLLGVAPERLITKHYLSFKMFVKMEVTFRQVAWCFFVVSTYFWFLCLMAYYGKDGDMKDREEEKFVIMITILGVASGIISGGWAVSVVYWEWGKEGEGDGHGDDDMLPRKMTTREWRGVLLYMTVPSP